MIQGRSHDVPKANQWTQALKATSLDFGFMYDKTTMMGMYRVQSAPQAEIQFRQNMRHQELVVEFQIKIQDPRPVESSKNNSLHGKYNRTETLKYTIPFSQLGVIHRVGSDEDKIALLISLETPPRFFRKWNEVNTHEDGSNYWNQNDAWYRQTDIVYNPNILKSSPLTLKKTVPIIDIGRHSLIKS
jgi:RNA-dependent RNA polymerase